MSASPSSSTAPEGGRIERVLADADAVAAARRALGEGANAWIVGGAVRDAARGVEVADVDLVLGGDVRAAARAIAAAAGAHHFELSSPFETWRVTARGEEWTLDLAALRAPTIEADLALRDFTVNAAAIPLAGGAVLDPCGGLDDLARGVLRAVSERSFEDDPLRLLRAARLGAGLGLELDPETERLAAASAARAAEPAGERQLAELGAMISGPDPLRALDLLDRLRSTERVLPELEGLRGVAQSANHHLDAHGHTLEVLRRALAMEADLSLYAGDATPAVAAMLAEPLGDGLTRRDGLRLAALLHDVGKPATRVEQEGWVSFKGHDAVGAEMVRAIFRRLRSSRRLADAVAAMTRDHLVLGFMVRERPLPPRRVWEYLRRTGAQAVDTTLLTVADRLSAQGGGVPEAAITGHVDLAREMLAAAVEWEREGPAEPLLRGDEIAAEVGIERGPDLGRAVRELEAAQYSGEVATRQAALAHLRGWRESG